jgi:disulfide bond formation protein DsbB
MPRLLTAPTAPILLAMAGAAAALVAAAFFQYVMGLAPCALCYWQRYAHGAILGAGALALVLPGRATAALGAAAAVASAGIALFHTGVERKWWAGLPSCSTVNEDLGGLAGADLLSTETVAPFVRCDEIPWQLLGLSMANWNVALSLGLAGLFLWAAARRA